MTVRIEKSKARGSIYAPASKSMAHRLLIAAALSRGESRIYGISQCDDAEATIDCLCALGVKVEQTEKGVKVEGIDFLSTKPEKALNCRESGSTLRFLIPLAMLCGETVKFVGTEKLISRPQSVYEEICQSLGMQFEKNKTSITVKGRLEAREYKLRGDESSQFITGLLFALSALKCDSRIIITTHLESRSYVDLTIGAMAEFGVKVVWENENTLYIKGGQEYKAHSLRVEGDYSGAAFIEALNYIGGEVKVENLNPDSLQGDRVYKDYFDKLSNGYCKINIENCPDLGPILFTLAAVCHGGRFVGTRRLKIKESDRAMAMKKELSKFGAELTIEENSVEVRKSNIHSPKERINAHNDHRIVMSMAVISSLYGGEIEGAEAVKKSYPEFFNDIRKLGIKVYEI